MFGFADRGNINNANPVWVMFWYNCIDTFVNGKRTQTNKRLLMRLKRWKTTQTGTFTGLKIQGELWHPTMVTLNETTFELRLSNTYSEINELRVWGKCCIILTHLKRFSYDLRKWFRQVFVICFISQWMKRSKHGLFVLPPNKILIWRRHCLIGKSCCSMTSKRSIRLISRKFLIMKFFDPSVYLTNQKPRAFVFAQ